MAREVKDPEVRKQELIDISKRLFFSRGYEKTSVRDILKEVDGAPGMFYHYFKSKREIYEQAMNQYITDYVSTLTNTLTNKNMEISDRLLIVMDTFEKTFIEVLLKGDVTNTKENVELINIMKDKIVASLVSPIAVLINDSIKQGIVKKENLPVDDVEIVSSFIMYGIYGIMNNESRINLSPEKAKVKIHSVPLLVSRILGVDVDILFKWRDLHGNSNSNEGKESK